MISSLHPLAGLILTGRREKASRDRTTNMTQNAENMTAKHLRMESLKVQRVGELRAPFRLVAAVSRERVVGVDAACGGGFKAPVNGEIADGEVLIIAVPALLEETEAPPLYQTVGGGYDTVTRHQKAEDGTATFEPFESHRLVKSPGLGPDEITHAIGPLHAVQPGQVIEGLSMRQIHAGEAAAAFNAAFESERR